MHWLRELGTREHVIEDCFIIRCANTRAPFYLYTIVWQVICSNFPTYLPLFASQCLVFSSLSEGAYFFPTFSEETFNYLIFSMSRHALISLLSVA